MGREPDSGYTRRYAFRATRIIASRDRSTSSSVVAHDETLMRIAV
jgi:hypothetical protein